MATQTPLLRKSFPADVALTTTPLGRCLVESPTNSGNVCLPADHFVNGYLALAINGTAYGGTKFVGVLYEQTDGNNEATLTIQGVAQMQSDGSGSIAAGDQIAIANINGQVKTIVPTVPGSPSTVANWTARQIIGTALSAAAATAGILVDVEIDKCTYMGG